ncbi:hypothetical protein H112_00387 [Trichophyton rubrum D6]|nr:uncharacterized protein TERG_08313 [Trichophyton rubrum CBS 118892]EZF27713.1 hypothetical protein H100_00388 [Trichophyton rubrum MR850]EZF46693.1 hypothetical protein H102_00387 [Trichophyton rubrum CBS 100081]EZF57358.1 hypothetical protein H103_00386 [Trichophyton rubrum CBS 288.86]EZF67935.1 hypothetical protein H104_00387 [Trichophyton rubrum CBS 289.86]EZF89293.1 hypothetical protein H110_00390 [Trichophyton rubrum MR1448]EZG00068.1 hypothetical protein H113_00390 [Trichophyton rubr
MASGSEEPSLLEYARYHGIALEQEIFSHNMALDGLIPPNSWEMGDSDDIKGVMDFMQAIDPAKISATRASTELLSYVLRLHKEYTNTSPGALSHRLLPDWYKVEQLKISPPIPEQDASHGTISAVTLLKLDPSNLQAPSEKLNVESDEGLEFPTLYTNLRDKILEEVASEKLVCHPTTASLILETLNHGKVRKLEYQKPTYHHQPNDKLEKFELCPRIEKSKETNRSSVVENATTTGQQLSPAVTRGPLLPGLFSASDSVSSFMEAHGKRPPLNDSSMSNCHNTKADQQLPNDEFLVPREASPEAGLYTVPLDELPTPSSSQKPIVLFMSADLLRTHGPLVHKLETLTNPPTLIFQDRSTLHSYNMGEGLCLRDADITLSPTVGMLLATTIDFMQLHLPGHSIQLESDIKLNSPFQERIYRTCKKYDELYIFTLHHADPSTVKPLVSVKQNMFNAMATISAFCNSMNIYSKVRVLNVSSDVTNLAHWIIDLGQRHQNLVLQDDTERIISGLNGLPPKRHSGASGLEPISSTFDEQFLTQCLALNCFAAAFVVHILLPSLEQAQETDQGLLLTAVFPGEESTPFPVSKRLSVGLGRLIDGKLEDKAYVASLLGERAFSRVRDRRRRILLSPFVPKLVR